MPIELLPNRQAETLAKWLREHPGAEIVSRDRASAYADGIRQGAPDAVPVADRWHLLKNLLEVFESVVSAEHSTLRATLAADGADAADADAEPAHPAPPTPEAETAVTSEAAAAPVGDAPGTPPWRASDPRADWRSRREREQAAHRRARRQQLYAEVQRLQQEGLSQREIAQALGLARATAKKYAEAATFPERRQRDTAPGKVAAWAENLERRWEDGCRDVKQLWQELRSLGADVGRSAVYRYVTERWGPARARKSAGPAPGVTATALPAPRKLAWLLICPAKKATAEALAVATRAPEQSPRLELAVALVQEFFGIVRERKAEGLGAGWRGRKPAVSLAWWAS